MIGYVMVGTRNLTAAINFYDTALKPLGLVRSDTEDQYAGYGSNDNPQKIEFFVTEPFDGKQPQLVMEA